MGRFISADTIVPEPDNPQAFNRYSYVLNNPLRYTDPTGHRECGEGTGDDNCDGDPDKPKPGEPGDDSASQTPTITSETTSTPLFPESLIGQFEWQNPPDNDFFNFFVNGIGKESDIETMNCWESILFAAYKSKQIDKEWIKSFYTIALNSNDPNHSIWEQLGAYSAQAYNPSAVSKHNLVFFTYQGDDYPAHVALSIGGDQVVSLWNQPNGVTSVQLTTVPLLLKSMGGSVIVTVGKRPWGS